MKTCVKIEQGQTYSAKQGLTYFQGVAAETAGATQLVLLHCVSEYPAPPTSMNLRTIPHLAQAFDCPTGLSDHTIGNTVATGMWECSPTHMDP